MIEKQYPELHQIIRDAGGIVHSDGNIFFTNAEMFKRAAQQPAQKELLTDLELAELHFGEGYAEYVELDVFVDIAREIENYYGITTNKGQSNEPK